MRLRPEDQAGMGLIVSIMQGPFRKLLSRLGINKAVSYTAGTKLFQASVQFAVLAAMARNLSPAEQGYFYTFQSVLALQIFFELGMTSVLIQVTSHESAPLDTSMGALPPEGSIAVSRLSSLLRYLASWYSRASGLFFVCVFISGVIFFFRSRGGLDVHEWIGPWLFSTAMTALSMGFQAMVAFTEGVGRINRAAKVRAVFGMTTVTTLLLGMSLGAELYAPGLSLLAGISVGMTVLFRENGILLREIWMRRDPNLKIGWTKELWGFQWRMALSWISGYLIFQFSTPVVFKLLGSVEAGRYGITQQVGNGISALSMAWATTRQAQWGRWIAAGDRVSLDHDFWATLKRTAGVNGLLACLFLGFMLLGSHWLPQYVQRFAPIQVVVLLLLCGLLNQIIFTEAMYLRAHKTEPLLVTSVAGALIMGIGSLLVASHGILPLAVLYVCSTLLIGLLWGTRIFLREKRKWERLAREG